MSWLYELGSNIRAPPSTYRVYRSFFWLSWQSLAAADSTCFQTWLLKFAVKGRGEEHQHEKVTKGYQPTGHSVTVTAQPLEL